RSAPSSPVCARVIRVPHRYRFVLHVPSTIQSSPLSLHDALPISPAALLPGLSDGGQLQRRRPPVRLPRRPGSPGPPAAARLRDADRKSTRLNSSHVSISYAVFCLKKKNPKRVFGESQTLRMSTPT